MAPESSGRPSCDVGSTPDADLVARLRAGDPAAFDTIYEAQRARLYTFLLRLTRDESLARDLSQETWLRLAANARRLSPDTEPAAWLFRVARNLFVSHRRWALVHEASLAALRHVLPARQVESPLERIASEVLVRRLERALAMLPFRYREVVLLCSVEGFSTHHVAAMLDLTPEAVRQRLARGRASLKRALETP